MMQEAGVKVSKRCKTLGLAPAGPTPRSRARQASFPLSQGWPWCEQALQSSRAKYCTQCAARANELIVLTHAAAAITPVRIRFTASSQMEEPTKPEKGEGGQRSRSFLTGVAQRKSEKANNACPTPALHPLRGLRFGNPGQQRVFDRFQVYYLLGCESGSKLFGSEVNRGNRLHRRFSSPRGAETSNVLRGQTSYPQ